MYASFNSAALAHLTKSELYALLAEYRAKLDQADQTERPAIRAAICTIEAALRRI